MKSKIFLFSVRDTKNKLLRLAETAHHHFDRKEPLQIFVSDSNAMTFVDELLWKLPEESFLPHTAAEESSEELLSITTRKESLKAKYIFNLSAEALILKFPFKILYEFDDFTSENKKALSEKRFRTYREKNFPIETLS